MQNLSHSLLSKVPNTLRSLSRQTKRFMGGGGVEPVGVVPRERNVKVGRAIKETGLAAKVAGGEEVFSVRRPLMPLLGSTPVLSNDTFIAPSATVIGDVTLYDYTSIWYSSVLLGDYNSIKLGGMSNVQDRCVISTIPKLTTGFPSTVTLGNYVSVGPNSVLTSCTIGDNVIIGEGTVIGSGSVISSNVILEPGTIVPEYSFIPGDQKWGGNPASYIEDLSEHATDDIQGHAKQVQLLAEDHFEEYLPYGNAYRHLEEVVEGEIGEGKV
ncbi:hypothetical protein TrST_g9308 [Triparma strigata]|uniref:Uncharacterized protein n=1 Tax=Triparma strigata TaxID=1606541 RepID=A0A9W7F4E6_9STRA|nr:hypothetical protein TrST_g9308 [Triparma strigata]